MTLFQHLAPSHLISPLASLDGGPFQALFAMLSVEFMRRAFLVATVLALLSGAIGYFVLLRQLVFAGDALSHVAFTGALGAVVIGLDPLLGLFGLSLLAALGIGLLGQQLRSRDVAVGTVLAWVLALGVLFLSLYTGNGGGNAQAGVNVLFGSILGIAADQALLAVLAGSAVLLVLLVIARPLLFVSLAPEVAAARGAPVRGLHLLFLLLLAIAVGEAVQVVGVLLLFALLIVPAGIAGRLVRQPYAAMALAALLALLYVWAGLTIGYFRPYPISFLISTLAFLSYLAVRLWQALRGRWWRSPTSEGADAGALVH